MNRLLFLWLAKHCYLQKVAAPMIMVTRHLAPPKTPNLVRRHLLSPNTSREMFVSCSLGLYVLQHV